MSSSRFPPTGDSRYPPQRDRSPPGRFDRRGSTQFGAPPSRPSDPPYRGPTDNYASAPPRNAPRAPKAQDGPQGGYPQRGRGGFGRGEARDSREFRSNWDRAPSDRYDRPGDRRPSPVNPSRARSRSPSREFRDRREAPARDLDLGSVNRNVRDGPPSASSAASDSPSGYFGGRGSGGYRGRGGRGDFDGRGRGRGTHPDDRDSGYRARSRSRDRVYDREYRDDRDRRDEDRRSDWDRGDYRRDPPIRPNSRNSGGSQTNPPTPLSATGSANQWGHSQNFKASAPPGDTSRRSSFAQHGSERAGEDIRPHPASARPDLSRPPHSQQPPSSPPQPTPVPAFGSVSARSQPGSQSQGSPTMAKDNHVASKLESQDPTLHAPKAPKAELGPVPTGPRVRATYSSQPAQPPTGPSLRFGGGHEPQGGTSPQMNRFNGVPRAPSNPAYLNQPRQFNSWTNPNYNPRQGSQEARDIAAGSLGQEHSPSTPTGPFSQQPKPIPTGPKLGQPPKPSIRNTIRQPEAPQVAPRRVSTAPRGPSIRQSMIPAKRDSIGEDRGIRIRTGSHGAAGHEHPRSAGLLPPRDQLSPRDHDGPSDKMDIEPGSQVLAGLDDQEGSLSDEDAVDLSEEDFEDQERSHQTKVKNIKARLPPSPRHHPEVMLLLDEVDAIAAALQDLENGILPPPEDTTERKPPLGLPSPRSDDADEAKKNEWAECKMTMPDTFEDLPIGNLKYLPAEPLTPVSEISFSGNDGNSYPPLVNDQVIQKLVLKEKIEDEEFFQDLRERYRQAYRVWRNEVDAIDERKRLEQAERAITPQPPPSESGNTPAPPERRGRSERTLDANIEEALRISKLEAEQRENEQRRAQEDLENSAKPDYEREAVIPDMLPDSEILHSIFEDYNHLMPTEAIVQRLEFDVPKDDFTAEEQDQFISGYVATPKKWGHIADCIPTRNFQECIRHYYLTKKDVQYKVIASKKNRRGRGRAKGAGRPRGSLIAADTRSDAPLGPEELTETGRPRRAAAPSSFNEPKRDVTETAKTPGRKPGGSRGAAAEGADGTTEVKERPTAGRGSRGGRGRAGKEGSGRGRGKASAASQSVAAAAAAATASQPPAPASTTQPSQPAQVLPLSTASSGAPTLAPNLPAAKREPSPPKETKPKIEDDLRADASLLVELQKGHAHQNPVIIPQNTENWRVPHPSTAMEGHPPPSNKPILLQQPLQAQQAPKIPQTQLPPAQQTPQPSLDPSPAPPVRGTGTQAKPNQPSSYWSVPENAEFKQLLGHYGTNWTAIANVLKTKTHVMAKNYYSRQTERGKDPELLKIASEADERIKLEGLPAQPPPTVIPPSSQQRRARGDSGAPQQSTAQRPLAPSGEVEAENRATPPRLAPTTAHAASPQHAPKAGYVPLRQANPNAAPPSSTSVQESPPSGVPIKAQLDQRTMQQGQRTHHYREERVPQQSAPNHTPVAARRELQPQEQEFAGKENRPMDQQRFSHLVAQQHLQKEEEPRQAKQQVPQNISKVQPQQQQQQQQQQPQPPPVQQQTQAPPQAPPPQQQQHQHSVSSQHVHAQEQDRHRMSQYAHHTRHDTEPQRQPYVQQLQPQPPPQQDLRPRDVPHQSQQHNRNPSMRTGEPDSRAYQPAKPAEPSQAMHRQDSYGPRYGQTSAQSPMNRPAMVTPPYHERPSSVPQNAPVQAPPPPPPPSAPPVSAPPPAAHVEKKRSNVMMLLNDEPEEPKPTPKPSVSARPPPPEPPRRQSPAQPLPIYGQPQQPSPYARHEHRIDTQPQQHPTPLSRHTSYGQPSYQGQSQPLNPPPPSQSDSRDGSAWSNPHPVRYPYQEQPPQTRYPQPPAASPPPQPSYISRQPSSPPTRHSHSRGPSSSYSHPSHAQGLAHNPYANTSPPSNQPMPGPPHTSLHAPPNQTPVPYQSGPPSLHAPPPPSQTPGPYQSGPPHRSERGYMMPQDPVHGAHPPPPPTERLDVRNIAVRGEEGWRRGTPPPPQQYGYAPPPPVQGQGVPPQQQQQQQQQHRGEREYRR